MNDQFAADYAAYTNLAFIRRGVIINETIMLERIIDEIMCRHFCEYIQKADELMTFVFGSRMTFDNKIQVFKLITQIHNPKFLEDNPTIINDIIKVNQERNVFAHYWLKTGSDLSELLKENKTVFIKFKNDNDYVIYDEDKFINSVHMIQNCIKPFQVLQSSQPPLNS